MGKVRQQDKDASLEHKYKPFVNTDTKTIIKNLKQKTAWNDISNKEFLTDRGWLSY